MNPDEPKTEEVKKEPIHSLRTYQGDVQEAMAHNKTSSTDIFLAEQNRKDSKLLNLDSEQPANTAARNKFFILLGSILLVLGVLTLISVYYIRSNEEVVIEQKTKALIAFSQEKLIPIASSTRTDFIAKLITEKKSFNLPVNSVLYINTTKSDGTPANLENMLALLAPQMPGVLTRSFENKYMIGIYSFDTNEPFIILTTNDFALSYSGMLRWEKDMQTDLGGLFGLPRASTTPVFVDEEFRNKDLRSLKDSLNRTILLYSFIDKNTLVITKSENIFTAVVSKYLISGQSR